MLAGPGDLHGVALVSEWLVRLSARESRPVPSIPDGADASFQPLVVVCIGYIIRAKQRVGLENWEIGVRNVRKWGKNAISDGSDG
jgi:hypothetical protein